MYPDFLTCGTCADEFPLSKITDFIQHKTSSCVQPAAGLALGLGDSGAEPSEPPLSCYICQQDFHTARGILHHIHYRHMQIVEHKDPPLYSFEQSCGAQNQQVNSAPVPHTSVSGPEILASTATTVSDTLPAPVSHVADDVNVSSSSGAEMPAACAKLTSTEGATICCNGRKCQVTINPTHQSPVPKKCCSSVLPKKRTRHMQEHDSEYERCALETLASLRGRLMVKQKGRTNQKKANKKCSKSLRNRKLECIMSCERGVVCVTKASEDSEAESKEEEGSCDVCDQEVEEGDDGKCQSHTSSKSDPKKSKVEIYSIEKDRITSRKTVIMNSGMTVTVQPSESAAASKKNQDDQVTPAARRCPFFSEDAASRESAQILAELMYHSSHPVEQSIMMPLQTLPTSAADGQVPLATLTDGGLQGSLSEPAGSALSTGSSGIPSTSAISFSSSLSPVFASANIPVSMEIPVNVAASGMSAQGVGSQPLDVHHLPDLDALTPSIEPLPALEQHMNPHGSGLSVPKPPVSVSNAIGSLDFGEGSLHDSGGRNMVCGKKRRYPTSRPYKCSECDQAFNQPIHLKKHMSKHTGVKPFKCESCEYSTVERSHLKAHNRIHTGEKPFQCHFCNYATAQNSTLKVHLRRHHQDRQTVATATTSATGKQA